MGGESVVVPAFRVPEKLWLYLEELGKRRMYTSTAELVREALRECVERHRHKVEREFEVIEAFLELEGARKLEGTRGGRLIRLAEELRSRHERPNS